MAIQLDFEAGTKKSGHIYFFNLGYKRRTQKYILFRENITAFNSLI